MNLTRIVALIALLPVLGACGCESRNARLEFDRQIGICSLAEDNGVLDTGIEACGAALTIAEQYDYPAERVSNLLLRLTRLERQRGNFQEAEVLVTRSLTLEEAVGDPAAIATRLVELSLSLAGQSRWLDGAQVLERASPLAGELAGADRKAAANAFRAFGQRLGRMGHTERAGQLNAEAEKLNYGDSSLN